MICESVGRKQLFPRTSNMKYLVTVNFLVYYCSCKSSYKKKEKKIYVQLVYFAAMNAKSRSTIVEVNSWLSKANE